MVVVGLAGALAAFASCGRSPATGGAAAVTSALVTDPATWRVLWKAAPSTRASEPMAYDADRKVMVVFGGQGSAEASDPNDQDTWEWNAALGAWSERTPAGVNPPPRYGHVMVYDTVRKKSFLFSGYSSPENTFRADQWEWDGPTGTWTERMVAGAQPSPRFDSAMVWDGDRQRAVLFGGSNGSVYLNDLWEWDGTTGSWTDRTPAGTKPAGRESHVMAYDSVRKKIVVYGGLYVDGTGRTISLDETWEWDGATQTWTEGPAIGDRIRNLGSGAANQYDDVGAARMVFDASRSKVVMYAADIFPDDSTSPHQVFEYAPSATPAGWTDIATTASDGSGGPSPAVFTYDSDRKVSVAFVPSGTLWEYDGAAALWTRHALSGPLNYGNVAFAYDSKAGKIMVFDGQDLWEGPGTGGGWIDLTNASANLNPSGRFTGAMVYDSKRDQILMIGGTSGSDIWAWTRSTGNWTYATTSMPPAPTASFYDAARDKVVTFSTAGLIWEWELDPVTSTVVTRTPKSDLPAGVTEPSDAQFAYDPDRSKAFLIGADDDGSVWEWDAATNVYSERQLPTGVVAPVQRIIEGVSYDSARGVVVMIGGNTPPVLDPIGGFVVSGGQLLNDSWEWDTLSGTWNETTGPSIPVPLNLFNHWQVFDPLNARTFVFGEPLPGDPSFSMLNYVWEYRAGTTSQPNDGGGADATADVTGAGGATGGGGADGGGADATVDVTGAGGATGGGAADGGGADAPVDHAGAGGATGGGAADGGGGADALVDHAGAGGAKGDGAADGGGQGGGAGCSCFVAGPSSVTSWPGLLLLGLALVGRRRSRARDKRGNDARRTEPHLCDRGESSSYNREITRA